TDTTTLRIAAGRIPGPFALKVRVPGWATSMTAKVNGIAIALDAKPGTWATISRKWEGGDVLELRIPLTLRMEPVDAQHPDRVAVMRGPVVFVLEGAYHDPNFALPKTNAELPTWLTPEPGSLPRGEWATGLSAQTYATSLRVTPPDKRPVRLRFRP